MRAFDDAEVTHVEGDVDPLRDMDIISTELRLKDIEWVEKHLNGLKKTTRSLGNTSLADKARKEEVVSRLMIAYAGLSSSSIVGNRREDLEDAHRRQQGRAQG